MPPADAPPRSPGQSVLGVRPPQGPPPPARPAEPQASFATARASTRGDLESRIGGNWFNRIGIIAIFFGVAFFLKYAVDNQWIGNKGRVLIGATIGIAFLIGGERLRKRYPSYAYGLTGGGIAVLYASIWFASFKRYDLLSPTIAFALMALVTATASLLAARYNALAIAVLGLIGGFLTPILLSTGVDNEAGLFSYIALLDAGVLAVAYSKQWRSLNYLSFIATILMFAAWMFKYYESRKLWTTIFFLTLFFIIFALLAVLYNVVNRRPARWLDLGMVFANGLLYFGTSYELLDDEYHRALGMFAVLVAAFYLALGYFTYRRDREDRLLVFTFLGLGFLFSVLAVPIQFDQHWITMGWAIEGAVMTWIGLRADDRTSRYGALVVFVISLSHWALRDVEDFSYAAGGHFVPLINRRALSCAVLIASLAAAAFFYKRYGPKGEEQSSFAGILLLAANSLAVALFTLDANDYFEQRKALASGREFAGSLSNAKALTLTALWSIYGLGVLFVGVTRRLKLLRYLSFLLLASASVKVLAIDLRYYDAAWHTMLFNQTFGAFALIVAALAVGARLYARGLEPENEERGAVLPLLIGTANLLLIIALSAEVMGHFARVTSQLPGSETYRIENTKQLALTAVWTVYGMTALIIGVRRRVEGVRTGSLLLLGLAAVKVITTDLRFYDAEWHTLLINPTFGAFFLLIIAFGVGAWLYWRNPDIGGKERLTVISALVGTANLLAIIALSAEAIGYFIRARGRVPAGLEVDIARLNNNEQFVLSALWTIFGAAWLITGIKKGLKPFRWFGLLLLAVVLLKIGFRDINYYRAPWHTLIFNETFAAFALLILALALGGWFYSRAENIEERSSLLPVIVVAANVLAIIALSTEVLGYFGKNMKASGLSGDDLSNLRLARQLWLSLVWTIYGGVMLTVGIARRSKLLRLMALGLLGLTIFKVFLFDLSSLQKLYRIISFIVLGLILLAVSFLYQRYRQQMAGLIGDADAPAAMNAESD